ncbi:MAG: N-acetylmuramic acid 6-phosphate etherase [Burkholderiaceae bacterium]|nr:N-acetylmuramic acid 6-phosphate etherase [Burkholderiaceae bacterium]
MKTSHTETPHPAHAGLDRYATPQLVAALVDDQLGAVTAVQAAGPALARAVDAAALRLARGGRLIYAGAGTSGRLGVLDAVELNPTFSWSADQAPALLAGGPGAMFLAVEGAEDDGAQGAEDLHRLGPGADDVVFAIAASGTTPFALGVLSAARAAGALTIGMANNPGTPLVTEAEIGIVLDTGPEVISGSTRLKAGTAQKIALNSFSSAVMVRLHKVYGNLMVDMRATNVKLVRRAVRLTMLATGCGQAQAEAALRDGGWRVKLAIVMVRRGLDANAARAALEAVGGDVRAALGEAP